MVAIVNNHWMYYKELLFQELANKRMEFTAIFLARSSSQRPAPSPSNAYPNQVIHPGHFEEKPALKTAYLLWRLLESLEPTTIVIEGWYDPCSWSAWLWARVHRVPIILWSESNNFDKSRNALAENLKKLFTSKVSCSHVYGRSNRDYLVSLGLPKDRVLVGRAVVDTSALLLKHPTFDAPPLRFLFVGRLSPEKNLEHLLSAFAALLTHPTPAHLLTIVGNGALDPILKEQARSLGIESNVKFVDSMPPNQLARSYLSSHVFILPSKSEPWGLVAAEAMCSGLPAIISRKCGCASDLVTEETGWLFDPDDEADLHRILTQVAMTSPARLSQMGSHARTLAASYSPANAADLVLRSVSLASER